MLVRELMQSNVLTVRSDQMLPDAVETMADQHVTGLAVLDHRDRLVGAISTADVLTAQVETPPGTDGWDVLAVEDVMTSPALTIAPDATIAEAIQRLLYTDVHRLFVEQDGVLVGVISQTDLVRALATQRLAF